MKVKAEHKLGTDYGITETNWPSDEVRLRTATRVSQRRGRPARASVAWTLLMIATNLALWYLIVLAFDRVF